MMWRLQQLGKKGDSFQFKIWRTNENIITMSDTHERMHMSKYPMHVKKVPVAYVKRPTAFTERSDLWLKDDTVGQDPPERLD
jgi:hypothetical protein